MHRGHDHHDHHHHGGSGHAGPGHNAAGRPAAQWQTPHAPGDHHHPESAPEPDFDLIEAAFADSFPKADDPTSFLRLAGIPFSGRNGEGRTLNLLRVEFEEATDVGSVTPHLGGGSLAYNPLPAAMVSRRRRLAFVYQADDGVERLTLVEARSLSVA
jgi:hypothetical protein